MTCDSVTAQAILERYLRRKLSEEDREAFEMHYFECERCFDDLRTLEAITRTLHEVPAVHVAARKPLRTWLIAAAGVAAVLLVAATAMVWRRTAPFPASSEVPTESSRPAAVSPPPLPPGENATSTPSPAPSLAQLARVEPAPYEQQTFRSVPDAATARFQQGMERYRQGDYRSAIADLHEATTLDPDAPHIQFFLGVSQLISGDVTGAIDSLRATIALGDTPYLEESHLYLAKAFLRQQNVAAAQGQLREVIALRGTHRAEATRLLEQSMKLELP